MYFMVFKVLSYYAAPDILKKYVSQVRVGSVWGKGNLREEHIENKYLSMN